MKVFHFPSIILLICISSAVSGQAILTGANSNPQVGDSLVAVICNNCGQFVTSPGQAGATIWDFSANNIANENRSTWVYRACNCTPYCDRVPSANIVASYDGGTNFDYYLTDSSRSELIAEFTLTDTVLYGNISTFKYPITYGSKFNSRSTYYNTNKPDISELDSDNSTTICDAYGTLILPGNDTVYNVLRLHTFDTVYGLTYHTTDISEQYIWMAPGYHPAFGMYIYDPFYITSADTLYEYLNRYHTTNIGCLPLSPVNIKVWPNPVVETLHIEATTTDEKFPVVIYNILGQQMIRTDNEDQIYVGDLPEGLYILKIFDKNHMVLRSTKLIKNR